MVTKEQSMSDFLKYNLYIFFARFKKVLETRKNYSLNLECPDPPTP